MEGNKPIICSTKNEMLKEHIYYAVLDMKLEGPPNLLITRGYLLKAISLFLRH